MRLFLDANIILDLALHREGFKSSAEVVRYCKRPQQAWIAWHTLSVVHYIMKRHLQSDVLARAFIKKLLTWATVATVGQSEALEASDSKVTDFEDALQVAAAKVCAAEIIITRNVKDFCFRPFPFSRLRISLNNILFLNSHVYPA